MNNLINNNLQYSKKPILTININEIVKLNKNQVKMDQNINHVLMQLLIESNDLELKGDIAAYFSNYL
jgi:hypothetical protein